MKNILGIKIFFVLSLFAFLLFLPAGHAAVVANWTLTSTTDTSGNGYTLNNNGVTFNAVGAQFSGAQYLNRSFIPSINKFTNWSVVLAFKMDSLTGSGSLFCYANGTNDRFCIDTSVSTGLKAGLYNGATYASRASFPRSYFNDTNWHCAAYIYNTSRTDPTFILDSAPSTEVNTPATGGGAVPQVVIGTRDDKVSNNFTGQISSILVYDTLLTNDQVLKACSDIRLQPAGVTVTTTPLSGNAPRFGSNIKSFQFIGEDYYIDTNGDGTLDTQGNTSWHRQYALAAGMTTWRADMRLDKSTAVNTFVGTNGSLYNVRTAQTAIEWMYANNMTLTLIADYMPSWLANVTSSCATNTQYCNPTNYTTWGQLVVNYIKNVTNNNATLQSIITVEVWNEPYLFFHSNGTVADRVNGYVPLYNVTYNAVKGNFTNMPVMLSTIYTQTLGNSFSVGVLGNLTAAGYRTDCTATHEYADTTLYAQIANESTFVSGYSNYSTCMALTEYNSFESDPQVNFSTSSRKWIADALINSVNYQRNFQQYQQYDWSDKARYTSNTTVFENFPHEYRIVSEPLLDNSIYYPYLALKQLNTYHSYGKTNVNTTSNTTTVLALASITGSNTMAVTLLNKNTGKNVILTFSNTSYTSLRDTSTGTVYSITGGVANVSIAADNISTFEASAPDVESPSVTWNAPTNTTYNTREISINLTAVDTYGNISAYWFSNGSIKLNLTPFSDWSGNNYQLNNIRGVLVNGSEAQFNGSNLFNLTTNTPKFIIGNYTISTWIYHRANQTTNAGVVTTMDSTANNPSMYIVFSSPNNIQCGAWTVNTTGTAAGVNSVSVALSQNTWNNVVCRYTFYNNIFTVNVTVNGVEGTGSSRNNVYRYEFDNTSSIQIGAQKTTLSRYFNGSLKDIRIYNATLNNNNVNDIYNNRSLTQDLLYWYQFSPEGTGRYIAQDGSNTWTGYANDTSNNVGSTGISFSVDRSISFGSTSPTSPASVDEGDPLVFSYVATNPSNFVTTDWYLDGFVQNVCNNQTTCTYTPTFNESGNHIMTVNSTGTINNIAALWSITVIEHGDNPTTSEVCDNGQEALGELASWLGIIALIIGAAVVIYVIKNNGDISFITEFDMGSVAITIVVVTIVIGIAARIIAGALC